VIFAELRSGYSPRRAGGAGRRTGGRKRSNEGISPAAPGRGHRPPRGADFRRVDRVTPEACHEAGHVVVGSYLGLAIGSARIEGRGGHVLYHKGQADRWDLATFSVAGPLSEIRFMRYSVDLTRRSEWLKAWADDLRGVEVEGGIDLASHEFATLLAGAEVLVARRWPAILQVSRRLSSRGVLTRGECGLADGFLNRVLKSSLHGATILSS